MTSFAHWSIIKNWLKYKIKQKYTKGNIHFKPKLDCPHWATVIPADKGLMKKDNVF